MEDHRWEDISKGPKPRKPVLELLWFFAIAACIKLLLIPSYHSTDFEVHRHWLALTHSLPHSQWYFDETSQWTLDYPPFFAYFERFLSIFANIVDPQIVHLQKGLDYNTNSVVYFQRITVIVSDLCLLYGVYRLTRNLDPIKRKLIWVLLVWSPALVIVDHLHFQYNGFLLGMLLISLSYLEEGRDLMGGFFFAVLLCFKHLFAVAAPVYFVYLLRHYCRGGFVRGFGRLTIMGSVVVAVFAAAYGPFIYHGQIQQVIRRMFPFGRGLCHAYWAPNFWVFYILLDKGLSILLRKLGFSIKIPTASFTNGLVGDSSPFSVLPQITPLSTFVVVLLALSPCLIKAFKEPQPRMITRWVAYAYACGFLFGWHVHEKASLHFVIPLAVVAVQSLEDARHYFVLSIVSCYSLFPLLFEAQEYPIKVLLLLLHSSLMWLGFSAQFDKGEPVKQARSKTKRQHIQTKGSTTATGEPFHIRFIEKVYIVGLLIVEIWAQFLHPFILGGKFPFVPLMLISMYCSLGVMYSWIWQLRWILSPTN
ncbi:probable dolichyl pyrophosphate Glc1Man9GlcNAc2 alpha-1,3-glucosyltransferase [Benincasa hispida]|uniref:probable dolichyl pyrophosphate Glc1Man9GlcNAc2 alpha-1,3-glucosyltransferase n=1 Tax=Benincasa hispida TaxID=102211 RepID=UPI0019013EE2|nr:probable dolichyl pyrophosphate Glc1Man9GlcNAc2 alpha-1,3-glucosyltransferase [Benincasa hispida]XP_038875227.1 probable dolichyl pyrophosphate Glc1Man9GlcNAc2 alpha-1,3-glucosyltransferase [Benincasa hispida]XP_038875228.1 probable dolichyl pyrophosphate Glc1Man9GlcNAc2 alpha-1,3-glucosyltransferase [Benincasa hispida]